MATVISFDEHIDEESISFLIQSIKKAKDKNIILVISSKGGNPYSLKPLKEFIEENSIRLKTLGIDRISSAAATMFMYGEERALINGASLLLHEPIIPADCNSVSMTIAENFIQELKDINRITFSDFYEKTSITPEMLREKIRDGSEWIIFADEALELGVATQKDFFFG